MNIYLIKLTPEAGWCYDSYDSFVIAAETPQQAREIAQSEGADEIRGPNYYSHGETVDTWLNYKTSRVALLGPAPGIKRARKLLGSFNAG